MAQKYKPLDANSDAFRRYAQQTAKLGQRGTKSTFLSQTADFWFEGPNLARGRGLSTLLQGTRGPTGAPSWPSAHRCIFSLKGIIPFHAAAPNVRGPSPGLR